MKNPKSQIRNPKSNIQDRAIFLLVMAALLLAACYLRLANLGAASFWVDELDFVNAALAKQELGEPLLRSGYAYPRAPFLTSSLMAVYSYFHVSEFTSRLPVAVFGLLTIPMIFWVGRQLFSTRVGLYAAIFLTFSPFAIGWSRTCRMYSLFQLTFLLASYLFFRGFEAGLFGQRSDGHSGKPGLRGLWDSWDFDLKWMLLGLLVLGISYTTHQNAALFFAAFGIYLLCMGLLEGVTARSLDFPKSKYQFWAIVALVCGGLVYLALPQVRELLAYAVGYQPKWAEVASAQNQWRIIEFFAGSDSFPINILFVLGLLGILAKRDRAGLYCLTVFAAPVLLFTFVFQYRKNDYIFHVLPLFFIIAAVGLDRMAELTLRSDFLKSFNQRQLTTHSRAWLVGVLLLAWFPLTPMFRFSQKIPRLGDGYFNGAVYHNEWREATKWLGPQLNTDAVLMSTLPLTVQYYLGRAEFNLNWANGDLARVNNIVSGEGQLIDFYSGAQVVGSLAELEETLVQYPQGWLLVDNYRFSNSVYVPEEVSSFIQAKMKRSFETKRGTVSIYNWDFRAPMLGTN